MNFEEMKEIMLEIAKIIEEYPEALREKAFDILAENIFGKSQELENSSNVTESKDEVGLPPRVEDLSNDSTFISKKIKKRNATKETYQINKDLNLSPKDKLSLKAFVENKQPKSNIEFNVVAIYYLEKILKKTDINIDDIYTCYKNVNKKVPSALKQSLTDTSSSKYGYIAVSNNCFSIPVAGENYVEFELPKNKGAE